MTPVTSEKPKGAVRLPWRVAPTFQWEADIRANPEPCMRKDICHFAVNFKCPENAATTP